MERYTLADRDEKFFIFSAVCEFAIICREGVELVTSMRESILSETHNTQRSEKLMKAAYKLLEQLQRCFCEDLCPKTRYQKDVNGN